MQYLQKDSNIMIKQQMQILTPTTETDEVSAPASKIFLFDPWWEFWQLAPEFVFNLWPSISSASSNKRLLAVSTTSLEVSDVFLRLNRVLLLAIVSIIV